MRASAGMREATLAEARDAIQAGNHGRAEPLLRRVLDAAPSHAEALRLLALLLHRTERSEDALRLLDQAVREHDDDAALHDLHGVVLKALGRLEDATTAFEAAVRLDPLAFGARFNLGNAHRAAEHNDDAVACYRRATRLDPTQNGAWNNLGDALRALGRLPEAASAFHAAVLLAPETAEHHFNLGSVLLDDDAATAEKEFVEAVRLRPRDDMAHYQLGRAREKLFDLEGANACYREALSLRPDNPLGLTERGALLQKLGRFDEALEILRHVHGLTGSASTLSNVANILLDMGQLDEAEALLREALELDPDHAGAHYNMFCVLLAAGRMREGFLHHEYRWPALNFQRRFEAPPWRGEPLDGKVLFIHEDQGVGDYIQFCRLVPLAAERGAVILQANKGLHRLLGTLAGGHRLIDHSDLVEAPHFDYHCPVLDLPVALGTEFETLPQAPYLAAVPEDVARWRERLAALPGRRVGLVWAGNPDYGNDRNRSLPFEALAPLQDLPGISFVSLQRGGAPWTLRKPDGLPGLALHGGFIEDCTDYADTAALVSALDLVVSVDTSVAHLAGALGHPVWLLNRFDSDWRWMRLGERTPWYPSMRIFRQPVQRDWAPVMAMLRVALHDFAAGMLAC